MRITVRFYGHLRDLVGEKSLGEYDLEERATVSILVDELLLDPVIKTAILDESQELKPEITLLKNGREIKFLDGTDTKLESGDVISIFPIVAGG